MISYDVGRNVGSESASLVLTDAKIRKHGEQTRLDTLVVLAVNDKYFSLG